MLLATIFAAGCSGGSSQLTAQQLTKRTNAICLAAGRPYAGQRPSDPVAFLDFLRAQLPAQEKGLTALKALRPPAAAQQAWSTQIIQAEQEQLADEQAAVNRLQELLRGADQSGASAAVVETTDRLDARGAGINAYWNSIGAVSCLDSPL